MIDGGERIESETRHRDDVSSRIEADGYCEECGGKDHIGIFDHLSAV